MNHRSLHLNDIVDYPDENEYNINICGIAFPFIKLAFNTHSKSCHQSPHSQRHHY